MDVTVEDKLRLLQKLRADVDNNQNAIQVRREILSNGKGSSDGISASEDFVGTGISSLKVRTFFAVLMVLFYLLMQYGGVSIGTFSKSEVISIISESSDIKLFDFQLRLPYTLEE